MSIIDSKTGKIKKDYIMEQLIEKTREMRAAYILKEEYSVEPRIKNILPPC